MAHLLWPYRIAGAAALVLASACSTLTEVDSPDVVQPPQFENPAGAGALRAGAIARFAEAVTTPGGSGDAGQIARSGMMADEFTSTFLNRNGDRRNVPGPSSDYPDREIQLARVNLLQAIPVLRQYAPEPGWWVGQLFALVGYTEIFFGENVCSGVPLSAIVDGQPEFGMPFTTTELFERALADLDSALALGAGDDRILHLARVGRARALLNLDRPADAAAAAAAVPTDFAYVTEHSAAAQPNALSQSFYTFRSLSVADSEGGNGLDFRSANDPRVPTELVGTGADGVTPAYAFTTYNTVATPIVLAGGIEARLIEAEAALRANPDDAATTGSGWLGVLNALRATAIAPALAPLPDPGTPEARVDLLFRERAFWLFGTGHRHGDLRRLVRQYGREVESVFPSGAYRAGLVYGDAVTYTLGAAEENNPNYGGCLSREA